MRKGFTLVELLAVIVILAVLALIIVPNVNKSIQNSKQESFRLSVKGLYDAIYQDQVELGFNTNSRYVYNNHSLTRITAKSGGTEERVDIKVTGKIPDGVGEAYLNNDGDIAIAVSNNKWCAKNTYEDNTVILSNEGECKVNRIVTLKETLESSTIVTTGSGLYKIGEEYRFRGGCNITGIDGDYACDGPDPVNNYVSINGQQYRIISMDSQGVKVMTQDKVTSMNYDKGGVAATSCTADSCPRNNAQNTFCQVSSGTYYGCNVYAAPIGGTFTAESKSGTVTQNSSLYDYLNTSSTEVAVTTLRNVAKSASWNIGAVTGSVSNVALATIQSQEAAAKANFKLGLINTSDYIQGSLDTSCASDPVKYTAASEACRNQNWIFNPSTDYPWTINAWTNTAGNSNDVWLVSTHNGYLNSDDANYSIGVRPVGYLNSDIQVTGGTGTSANPWVLQA